MMLAVEDGTKILVGIGPFFIEWADVLIPLKSTTFAIEFRKHLDFISLLCGRSPAAAEIYLRLKSTWT